MPIKPVQISIDSALLERIDADPEACERGRSAFVRTAIERYLAAKERRQVERRIADAYCKKPDEALVEINDLVDAQSWPDD